MASSCVLSVISHVLFHSGWNAIIAQHDVIVVAGAEPTQDMGVSNLVDIDAKGSGQEDEEEEPETDKVIVVASDEEEEEDEAGNAARKSKARTELGSMFHVHLHQDSINESCFSSNLRTMKRPVGLYDVIIFVPHFFLSK